MSYDSTLTNGMHFGGILLGTSNWLWQAGPSRNLNGAGNYEIGNGLSYGGNCVFASDRNVYFGFHGEFFRGQGEAGQHFHFYDDGLFVGQFGESSLGHSAYDIPIPAFVGNGYSPVFLRSTTTSYSDYYLWVNDESAHGPQRWHWANARNIRESSGFGNPGGTITVTNEPCAFPLNLTAKNGFQTGKLSWKSVPGAVSYNIYYSLLNGGPYTSKAGSFSGTNYSITGLTNGQHYYCVVSAVTDNGEGIPSEQVEVSPFDTNQLVLCAGSLVDGVQNQPIIVVDPKGASSNAPSLLGWARPTGLLPPADLANYGFGDLTLKSVGTQGYLLYDFGGPGVDVTNLASAFSITRGSGWTDLPYISKQYLQTNSTGLVGTNLALSANPIGSINISVKDNAFHFLTVLSPTRFADGRTFTMKLISTNGTAAEYDVNEANGYMHTFQFLFRGDVTLQANAASGSGGIVQSLFLDDASVIRDSSLAPPGGVHIFPP